jgi:anti-sigma regulatory factor (Ser/Thr protein kinase)
MPHELISQFEFEADAINLKVIRNNLKHIFTDFSMEKKLADNLVIALNEACMNIIQHAYSNTENTLTDASESKKILIIIKKNNQYWQFELIDFAPVVDIRSIKSRDLNDVKPGGLGVSFIKQIMDRVEYENLNHKNDKTEQLTGNRLVLTKNI